MTKPKRYRSPRRADRRTVATELDAGEVAMLEDMAEAEGVSRAELVRRMLRWALVNERHEDVETME